MNRASYSRVPLSDADQQDCAQGGGGGGGGGRRQQQRDPNVDVEENKRQHRNRVEQCSAKVQAFLWLCAASFMVYSTNLFSIVLYDDRVHRGWFNVGLFCFGIAVAMMLYAVVWLPYVKKIHYDVEVVSPRFIPVAAVVCTLQGIWCVPPTPARRVVAGDNHNISERARHSSAKYSPLLLCNRREEIAASRVHLKAGRRADLHLIDSALPGDDCFAAPLENIVLSFCVGLWPVFGLFTPAVLGLVFMGALMSTHFIPYV
jgi:hypothetical protein